MLSPRHTLVLGLPALTATLLSAQAGEAAPQAPDASAAAAARAAALARMRDSGAFGLAFVVPARTRASADLVERTRRFLRQHVRRGFKVSADEVAGSYTLRDQVDVFAAQLHALLSTADPDLQRLLLQAVVFCADAKDLSAKPGENVVLLDADGNRVAGATLDLLDHGATTLSLRELVLGSGRDEQRRKRIPRADVLATRAALAVLPATTAAAAATYHEFFASLTRAPWRYVPILVDEAARDPRARAEVDKLLEYAFWSLAWQEATPRLPFGVTWETRADPCATCGMGSVGALRARLHFLLR